MPVVRRRGRLASSVFRRSIALMLPFLLLPGIPAAGLAADVPMEFSSAVEEERYRHLLEDLRCLVCQNQSLADSAADLAQDLRNEVYQRVRAGEDDEAIIGFLVQRYGDFVLYRPPLKKTTWLLWGGPFLLLAIAVLIITRRRRGVPEIAPLDPDEQKRLRELLSESKGGKQS